MCAMTDTLTIRLTRKDRAVLEEAASRQGVGLSAYIRDLAEAEARRQRRTAIRAEGERWLAGLSPEARAELELLGTPQSEPPPFGPSPEGWQEGPM